MYVLFLLVECPKHPNISQITLVQIYKISYAVQFVSFESKSQII